MPVKPIFTIYDTRQLKETPKNTRGGRLPKYPFDALKIGQSFVVPASLAPSNPSSLRVLTSNTGAKLGRKFSCTSHKGEFEITRVA